MNTKIRILDYRTQSIRYISKDKLDFIAPELYIRVERSDSKYGIYKYTYKIIKTNKLIDWCFSFEELKNSKLNFNSVRNLFLKSQGVDEEKIELFDKVLYLNEESINELME